MPGRLFTIWILITIAAHAPSAWPFGAPCPQSQIQRATAAVTVPVCVDMCSSLVRGTDASLKNKFTENCAWHFAKESHPILAATYNAARWARIANVCLFLTPIEGYVISPIEFLLEIPQMISYMVSAIDQSESAQFWGACSAHIKCRRGLARNTIRLEHASDAEIDQAVSKTAFNDLLLQAQHDHNLLRDDCMQRLGEIRNSIRSDGEDWTPQRNKLAFFRLSGERPICPGILHLERPRTKKINIDVPKPAKPTDKAECMRTNPHPWSCLPEN